MHYGKVPNGGEIALIHHNARTHDIHGNKNINPDKSKWNRNLTADDGRSSADRFHDRIRELSFRKQKNNVRMCEIVISAPKGCKGKDIGLFFKTAHKALQGFTGGPKNEVSAWVHLDEKTPHMHYQFVPGIEINGVMKLSAKRLIDRDALKNLHPMMQQAIDQAFGHHNYLVVADDPKDRQQTSDTLKAFKSKMAKQDSIEKQIKSATDDLQTVQAYLQELTDKIEQSEEQLQANQEIGLALEIADSVKADDPNFYNEMKNWYYGNSELDYSDCNDIEL